MNDVFEDLKEEEDRDKEGRKSEQEWKCNYLEPGVWDEPGEF